MTDTRVATTAKNAWPRTNITDAIIEILKPFVITITLGGRPL